jgi:hypothetical protein
VPVPVLPRIALPCKDTRALSAAVVVAVRARTLRVVAAPARVETVFAPLRDTTLRLVIVVPRVEITLFARGFAVAVRAVVRALTFLLATARGFAFARAFVAVRATVAREVAFELRGLARPDARGFAFARAAWGVAYAVSSTGAIGSAKTARIDKNVEHTKNAPASKKTVPTAFFNVSATF